MRNLHNLCLTCKVFHQTCIPYLYRYIASHTLTQHKALTRTFISAPEFGKYVLAATIGMISRPSSTETNDLLQTVLEICYNMKELSIFTDEAVHMPADMNSTSIARLATLKIHSSGGMSQVALARLIAACPKLENFEYVEYESEEHHGIEPVSPKGISDALVVCKESLRSLRTS